jgi:hypothetical protein
MKKFMRKFRTFIFANVIHAIKNLGINYYHNNFEEYDNKRMLENPLYLDRYGYKVFSEADEDGIIAEIFNRIGITNKKFVDFGAGNGLMSNSHFLLHKGWSGVWIEGSRELCKKIKKDFAIVIDRNQLKVINSFITKNNINDLIDRGGVNSEIDFLSIDIDGNDYWVWKAITCISPRVVMIEYNAKWPPTFEWIMKYDEQYSWNWDDNQGASLKSLELLGTELGYQLVGTSTNGVNAFFVKNELANNLFPLPATAENLYHSWKGLGIKTYISGHPSKRYIGN